MSKTEQGAFCSKCALNVYDFTDRSNTQIKQIILSERGKHLCGRITQSQEDALNAEFLHWSANSQKSVQRAFLVSLLVVFGLSLFSCTDHQDKKAIRKFQKEVKEIVKQQETVAEAPVVQSTVIEAPLLPVEVMYAPELDTIIEEQLEEVEIVGYKREYMSVGMMAYSHRFENFLAETTPVTSPDEYDSLGNLLPNEFSSLAYPNPASTTTMLQIAVAKGSDFSINLMDLNGRHLQLVHTGKLERSTFRKEIDLTDLPAGAYLITIFSGEYKEIVRVVKI